MTLITHIDFKDLVKDRVGSNDGTWVSGETYVAGIFDMIGRAGRIQGGAHITLANEANFDRTKTQPFSVSFWVKMDAAATGSRNLSTKQDAQSVNPGWQILYNGANQRVEFLITDSTPTNYIIIGPGNSVIKDKWHHILCTKSSVADRSGMKIYIDGVLRRTGTALAIAGTITNNVLVTIGAESDGNNAMNGSITDWKFWDAELVLADAQQLFAEGTSRYGFTSWDGDVT